MSKEEGEPPEAIETTGEGRLWATDGARTESPENGVKKAIKRGLKGTKTAVAEGGEKAPFFVFAWTIGWTNGWTKRRKKWLESHPICTEKVENRPL